MYDKLHILLVADKFWDRNQINRSISSNLNLLLRHQLDRFPETGNYLYFSELLFREQGISLWSMMCYKALVSSDVLVKFVQIAIDSCCVIQRQLNLETKPGRAQELLSAIAQTIIIVRALILIMIRINDKNVDMNHYSSNLQELKGLITHNIAKILLDEVLYRCPTVSAPILEYSSPVANILFNICYKPILYSHLIEQYPLYNYKFMVMILQSQCDLNAPDSQGNTILHNVICDIVQDIHFFHDFRGDNKGILTNLALEIVKLLLGSGSYPHAKNKEGKCPLDELTDDKLEGLNPEDIKIQFKELAEKYDSTSTLKFLAATKIVDLKIPYGNSLPDALVKFVALH